MAAHVLDYVLYGFLMALGVAQGLYVACRRRRGHDVGHETFLGGRSLGVLPLAVSVLASTGSPLGLVAMTAHFYAYGLHTAWTMLLTVCAVPLVVFFVVPGYYRLGVTSIFQASAASEPLYAALQDVFTRGAHFDAVLQSENAVRIGECCSKLAD